MKYNVSYIVKDDIYQEDVFNIEVEASSTHEAKQKALKELESVFNKDRILIINAEIKKASNNRIRQ